MADQLIFNVTRLRALSSLLSHMAAVASDRLSLTQAAFFMDAATADAAGIPATRSEIIAANSNLGPSIRNSYRQLLEPSRVYPKALGWLCTEKNPLDARERVLRLTSSGREVVERALAARAD